MSEIKEEKPFLVYNFPNDIIVNILSYLDIVSVRCYYSSKCLHLSEGESGTDRFIASIHTGINITRKNVLKTILWSLDAPQSASPLYRLPSPTLTLFDCRYLTSLQIHTTDYCLDYNNEAVDIYTCLSNVFDSRVLKHLLIFRCYIETNDNLPYTCTDDGMKMFTSFVLSIKRGDFANVKVIGLYIPNINGQRQVHKKPVVHESTELVYIKILMYERIRFMYIDTLRNCCLKLEKIESIDELEVDDFLSFFMITEATFDRCQLPFVSFSAYTWNKVVPDSVIDKYRDVLPVELVTFYKSVSTTTAFTGTWKSLKSIDLGSCIYGFFIRCMNYVPVGNPEAALCRLIVASMSRELFPSIQELHVTVHDYNTYTNLFLVLFETYQCPNMYAASNVFQFISHLTIDSVTKLSQRVVIESTHQWFDVISRYPEKESIRPIFRNIKTLNCNDLFIHHFLFKYFMLTFALSSSVSPAAIAIPGEVDSYNLASWYHVLDQDDMCTSAYLASCNSVGEDTVQRMIYRYKQRIVTNSHNLAHAFITNDHMPAIPDDYYDEYLYDTQPSGRKQTYWGAIKAIRDGKFKGVIEFGITLGLLQFWLKHCQLTGVIDHIRQCAEVRVLYIDVENASGIEDILTLTMELHKMTFGDGHLIKYLVITTQSHSAFNGVKALLAEHRTLLMVKRVTEFLQLPNYHGGFHVKIEF